MPHLKDFNVKDYRGVELEYLGETLTELVLRHIGMKRFQKTGIKVFDISDSELGNLIDKVILVNRGIDNNMGLIVYQKHLTDLIEAIGDLKGEDIRGSVVNSLKRAVSEELRVFKKENLYLDDLWEL